MRKLPATMPLPDRLSHYSSVDSNGCRIWNSHVCSTTGYPQLYWDGRARAAHRLAWVVANGPIPEGLHVCHRCDVRACINPDHLFLGTHRDNMVDRGSKGRAERGQRHHNAVLTDAQVRTIRASSGSSYAVAREHEIHPSTVQKIRNGKAWAHIK